MDEGDFDWDDLRLFLAVAGKGGLAAAASATDKSAPTLGRRMLALERRTRRELFRRLLRGYELTADGETLLAQAAGVRARIAPLAADRSPASVRVVISAGMWVMRLLTTQAAALIGVRNARPEGGAMAVRRTGRVRFAVYARDAAVTRWARVLGTTPSG